MFNYCPPVQLPDIKATTFPDGKRYYTLPDGSRLPSVTTVIGAQKKQSIMEWRRRVGEAKANEISKFATGRGTNVHTICENYLNNKTDFMKGVMPDAVEMFLSLKPHLNRINNIWYQEQSLWSKQLVMAGRCDCIAEFDGVLSVIDFKTSSRIKTKDKIEDYFAQCCAYSLMLEEMIQTPVNQIVIIMAVQDNPPSIFIEKTENYIETLVEYIKFYREMT